MNKQNIIAHNESVWDRQAESQCQWSVPVAKEVIEKAKTGQWAIHITKRAIPAAWLPHDIKGKDILCLASAGGQQAPVLAAAGANVTVVDISKKQLEKDEFVAQRDGLNLHCLQADMRQLDVLQSASFDYIIHPISNLYVPELNSVWAECFRVLRPGGKLMSSFYNPVLFVFSKDTALSEQGLLKPQYSLPYSDLNHLDREAIEQKKAQEEALIFGHTLSSQINGQLEAGFLLAGFYEDEHPSPRFLIENYVKALIATLAVKPI